MLSVLPERYEKVNGFGDVRPFFFLSDQDGVLIEHKSFNTKNYLQP